MVEPVDREQFRTIHEDDLELLGEILAILRDELPGRLETLRILLRDGKIDECRRLLHTIRSSCLSAAALRAAGAAGSFEEASATNFSENSPYFINLRFEIETLLEYYSNGTWRRLPDN